MCPSTNTRWCPAPQQVMVLEELYRRGLRTPNASQIQKITAHLSLYGKVQGKNVFYWFQNHKARDRQKLRNKLAKQLHFHHHHQLHLHSLIPPPSSAHYPPFQGNGVWKEEAPDAGEMMRQQAWTWRPSDHRTYGHDSTMVGPTFPCCRSKPLQTLQLFPLTSPSASATHHETPTSSFSINN